MNRHAKIMLICAILGFAQLMESCKTKPTEAEAVVTQITGRITDRASSTAIAGASITTIPVSSSVTSDASGSFTISNLSSGQYLVTASKDGFKSTSLSVQVTEGQTASAFIQLQVLSPELSVSPAVIDFGISRNQVGLSISNGTSVGTLSWTIAKNAGWLSLSSVSGSATTSPVLMTLTVDRTNLSPGNYNSTITFTSNGGNKDVPVSVTMQNPNAPQLTVTPLLLDFGDNHSASTFTITNSGTGKILWSASSSSAWATVTPAADSTTTESDIAVVTVARQGVGVGSYTGQVVVSSNAGIQTVSLKMSVPSVPTLATSSTQLDFDSSKTQLPLSITNAGSGSLNWSATKDQPWIQLLPTTGTNSGIINVGVSRSGLGVGNYSGSISIVSNGGTAQVGVSMLIPPPKPPTPATLNAPSSITSSSLSLTWSVHTIDPDFAGFRVYRDVSANVTESSTLLATIQSAAQTSYQVTGLSPASTYYFRVFVSNSAGASSGSNTVSARTNPVLGRWAAVPVPSSATTPFFYSFAQIGDNDLWIGGRRYAAEQVYYGQIWHSAGSGWNRTPIPDSTSVPGSFGHGVYGLSFVAANDGWATTGTNIMHYNGAIWSIENSGTMAGDIVAFATDNVWAGGAKELYHWNGAQWSEVPLGSGSFKEIRKISSNEGLAIDGYGHVFYYDGTGWSSLGQIPGGSGNGISGTGQNDVWAVNMKGAYHYDGNVWSEYADPTSGVKLSNCNSVLVTSTADAWIVCDYGWIYHWDGYKWSPIASPTTTNLNRLVRGPTGTIWAIGNSALLKYN